MPCAKAIHFQRTTVYSVQNDTVLTLPRDRRQRVNGQTWATHFGAKLKAQNVSCFSPLQSDKVF